VAHGRLPLAGLTDRAETRGVLSRRRAIKVSYLVTMMATVLVITFWPWLTLIVPNVLGLR
jgi:hypothetical protein